MRFYSSIVTVLLSTLLLCGASAHAQKSSGKGAGRGEGMGRGESKGKGKGSGEAKLSDKIVAATKNVKVTLTTGAGNITVRGWDRKEVHAQAKEADARVELRKVGGADVASNPASHVEVLISSKSDDDPDADESDSPLILDVPSGATVFLKFQDGDVDVDGITEAHIEVVEGRVDIGRLFRAIYSTRNGVESI